MDIQTDDGIEIFVLPDTAFCSLCKGNPLFLNGKCPVTDTDICKPSYCYFYGE